MLESIFMENSRNTPGVDIKPLTSLRFFAAAGVVFAHYGYNYNTGGLGVEFFFILSGFILSINYKSKFQTISSLGLRSYYISRIARIYPVHIVTFFISIPLIIGTKVGYSLTETISNILLVQAWYPAGSSLFSYNGVSWTLSCEIFFYFLLPFLTCFFCRFFDSSLTSNLILILCAYTASVLLTILTGPSITQFSFQWWLALTSPFSRAFDFIAGTAAGLVYLRNRKLLCKSDSISSIIEISCLIFFALFYYWHHIFASTYLWNNSLYFNLVISAFIYIFSFQAGILSSLLSNKALVYLGEVSFSMYMVHQLMIRYYERYIGSIVFNANSISGAFKQILFFLVVIAVAILVYEKIEKPLRNNIRNRMK